VATDDEFVQTARQLCKRDPLACQETNVQEINLVGQWLQYFERLLFICPSCGTIAEYQPYHFRGEFPLCAVCAYNDGKCPWTIRNSQCRMVQCDFCGASETKALADRKKWATANVRMAPIQEIQSTLDVCEFAMPSHDLCRRLRAKEEEEYADPHRVEPLYLCDIHLPPKMRRGESVIDFIALCKEIERVLREQYQKRMRAARK